MDNMWGADLNDIQLISEFNKGFYGLLIFIVNMHGCSFER